MIELEINSDTTKISIDESYIKNMIKSEIAGAKWGKDMQWGIRLMQDNQITEALKYFDQAEEFLSKNPDLKDNTNLLKYLINENLSEADINNACEKIKFFNKGTNDDYLQKFKIYCLINGNNLAEAQLQCDLLNEKGSIDNFYNKKINYL